MAPVALTFAVLDASGSTSQLGLVLAARMVPMLAFSLVGVATVLVASPPGPTSIPTSPSLSLCHGHWRI